MKEEEETEAHTGRESKSTGDEKTPPPPKQKPVPYVTDEDFIEKRAVFSQFPVDILCSLFLSLLSSPPLPLSLCVCAITADCLKSIKMVVG